jgi:arylsulfatase A-like enzyme
MNRRAFLKTLGTGVAALAASQCAFLNTRKKTNIIFLMADDLGYGDLGCYGATQIPTPNIDRMAQEGVRFLDAHAPAAVCTPTRYGVLTGRYCWRSRLKQGVLWGYDPLLIEPDRMTVASMLKQAGYRTACVGKWHLGLGNEKPVDYSKPLTPGPNTVGFDYFFGIPASLDMPPYCFIENDRTVGELSVEKEPYNTLQRKGPMTPGWKDEEVGPTFVQKAKSFITAHVRQHDDQPFFLYMPYQAPHTPCTPPDFIKGKSQAGVRGDMVVELDWAAGQILTLLKELHVDEDTLFVLSSDNGALTVGPAGWKDDPPEKYDLVHNGHLPNGELRGQKSDTYEGGHREPFIARWPGRIPAATTSHQLLCLTDLMATFAAVNRLTLPDNAAEDSFDMLPALTGQANQPIRTSIVQHSGRGVFAFRYEKWKLILGRGSGGFSAPAVIQPEPGEAQGQLYNLELDPWERHNVWNQHPDIVRDLVQKLERIKTQGFSRPGIRV